MAAQHDTLPPEIEHVMALAAELRKLQAEGRLTKAKFQRVYRTVTDPSVVGEDRSWIADGFAKFARDDDWFEFDPPLG